MHETASATADRGRSNIDAGGRPEPGARAFSSPAVDRFVEDVARSVDDPHVRQLFVNCYPNTLDTTVRFDGQGGPDGGPDTFVITGDIPHMWLRDSAAQVWPYLHLVAEDQRLAAMFEGLISRQVRCILCDPYANAFLPDDQSFDTHFADDLTEMRRGVYERKWEVDSLAYFLRLSAGYWTVSGRSGPFGAAWLRAVRLVLETFEVQRGAGAFDAYRFQRTTPHASDTQPLMGRGNPGRPCGLIRSSFRCSDDASVLPYLIPSNLMAAAELERAAALMESLGADDVPEAADLARRARAMAGEVRRAVLEHGVVQHPTHGRILAYEVDGYGSVLLLDDAGIPGLLSLAYLGAIAPDDALYRNTRRFALSADNPYYFEGTEAAGLGSPHTAYGSVWPMGLIARGLTAGTAEEAWRVAVDVAALDAGTGFCHESLDPSDPANFTRPWFAWVNGLFGELVCKAVGRPLYETRFEATED